MLPRRFQTVPLPKIPYIAPAHQPHLVNCSIPFAVDIAVETETLRRGIASRFYLRFCPQESGILFDCSGSRVRRSLLIGICIGLLLIALLPVSAWAQEATPENPTTGTIQGTLRDDDGSPVEGARVLYNSAATDTRGVIRSGKDGTYASEPVPPGAYVVRVEGRDMLPVESTVAVAAGAAGTAAFQLASVHS